MTLALLDYYFNIWADGHSHFIVNILQENQFHL
jgi:hypothetical protein